MTVSTSTYCFINKADIKDFTVLPTQLELHDQYASEPIHWHYITIETDECAVYKLVDINGILLEVRVWKATETYIRLKNLGKSYASVIDVSSLMGADL